MKLAIIGASPLALEAALRFHWHGASLTLFLDQALPHGAALGLKAGDYRSPLGERAIAATGKGAESASFSWETWAETYAAPVISFLGQHQAVRSHPVVSVTKRFLSPTEEIPGRSRFHDLFRVIFLVEPQQFIEEQKAQDPEKYQRLSAELVGSLQTSIEMFEDFDLVLDLRWPDTTASLSPTGRALGEGRISQDKLCYGPAGVHRLTTGDLTELRELALVGSGYLAASALIALEHWLGDERSRLFLVTTEEDPFAAVLSTARPEFARALERVLNAAESKFKAEADEFQQKLRDWQELDDFIRAKKPRPVEPLPRLVFFSGHNATAVDELIDRRRLFLTLERPDFREGKKHPDNNLVELKTIGVDKILACLDPGPKKGLLELAPGEPGHFAYVPRSPASALSWERDLEALKEIEDAIFKLFSPADHH
jgi:hypothetical protein